MLVGAVFMNPNAIYSYLVLFFCHLWQLVRNWLCVHSMDPPHILDHFIQFGSSTGYGKSRCSFMHLIWFATTWVIWKERNARIFRGTQIPIYNFRRMSNIFPSGGLKLVLYLFIIIFTTGAKTLCYVQELANFFTIVVLKLYFVRTF